MDRWLIIIAVVALLATSAFHAWQSRAQHRDQAQLAAMLVRAHIGQRPSPMADLWPASSPRARFDPPVSDATTGSIPQLDEEGAPRRRGRTGSAS